MERLPPVTLGAIIAASFALAYAARFFLEPRYVLAGPRIAGPSRQFTLDFLLCLGSGLVAGLVVEALTGFPLVPGWKLLLGGAGIGFFYGLELSLLRVRELIRDSAGQRPMGVPPRLKPISRAFALVAFAASSFIFVLLGLLWLKDIDWLVVVGRDPEVVTMAKGMIATEIAFVMTVFLSGVGWLIFLFSGNLKLLFSNEIRVLDRISQGDLAHRATVATADEFGVIAARTNEMIDGLSHRMQLLDALKVAEEVQRNLLPPRPPRVPGLDIAAASRYCDETGGDSFDFLPCRENALLVLVGDVAGHGVGPALLMASARAYLRSAADGARDPGQAVTMANRHICADVQDTGRFLTLLYLELDTANRRMRWGRAGHDPPIFFPPLPPEERDREGKGPPLGVVPHYGYQTGPDMDWPVRTLVCLGTDGIWETAGPDGEMFGKARLEDLLREHAGKPAQAVVDAVLEALDTFRGGMPRQDDVTLVVIVFP
jgi:sigma-B regulation protein RsbU (phosphoserine phosphatase)